MVIVPVTGWVEQPPVPPPPHAARPDATTSAARSSNIVCAREFINRRFRPRATKSKPKTPGSQRMVAAAMPLLARLNCGSSTAAEEDAAIVTVPVSTVPVPSNLKLAGLKLQVAPAMAELQLMVTVRLYEPTSVMVREALRLLPDGTETLDEFEFREKSRFGDGDGGGVGGRECSCARVVCCERIGSWGKRSGIGCYIVFNERTRAQLSRTIEECDRSGWSAR